MANDKVIIDVLLSESPSSGRLRERLERQPQLEQPSPGFRIASRMAELFVELSGQYHATILKDRRSQFLVGLGVRASPAKNNIEHHGAWSRRNSRA